jgi:DNA-binding LytR/AlgR family response regulator
MNCIIIDDDKLARSLLENYIKRTKTLKLLGSFQNPIESYQLLSENKNIDLVFLDIIMPEMNGLELLKKIDRQNLQIIVVSGYSGYALETFEYDITDFIVKPIAYERFFKAVEKAYKRSTQKRPDKFSGKLYIKKDKAFNELYFDHILYIESTKNGLEIFTSSDTYTLNITLAEIQTKLPNTLFIQVDESCIVNCENVSNITEKSLCVGHTDHEKIIPLVLISKEELISKINSK